MTDTETLTDPLAEFRRHLSRKVNTQLRDTGRAAVLVHRATYEHGWTAKKLAAECMRDHNGAVNPAAIVMHRLEHCADNPPAQAVSKRVHNGCCEGGLIYDETGDIPVVTKCPGARPAPITGRNQP